MNQNNKPLKGLLAALALILVAMYAAGLIAMLMGSVQTALILWVVSTLGGILMLYLLHTKKRREEAEKSGGTPTDGGEG